VIASANASPCWILGSSRSGSTWLSGMLADLEGIAVIDDPHIGHHLGVWRPLSLAWSTAEHRPRLQMLSEVKSTRRSYFFNDRYAEVWKRGLRDLIEARFAAEAHDLCPYDLRAIFVKEPGSQIAPLLMSLFPESRLVFLVRDGRDVVDSWVDAYGPGSWALDEGAYEVSTEGREPLVRWLASVWCYRMEAVAEAYDAQDPSRRVMVRYEDLLDDPVSELTAICAIAGLRDCADPIGLARIAGGHRFDELPGSDVGPGCRRRIASPGGWRDNLTFAEQDAMETIMSPTLERLGYLDRSGVA
jgi:hypothetical protein